MLKRKQYELSLWQTSLINNNKTEEKILKNVKEFCNDKILIIITHRKNIINLGNKKIILDSEI